MTIKPQDFSSTIIDNIDDLLDFNSPSLILKNFSVMQIQLKISDEFLKELIIPKTYKNLRSIFFQFNANFISSHQHKNHAIELKSEETLLFGPLYHFFKYQTEDFCEYIDKNLANEFICPSKYLTSALILFSFKLGSTLQFCVDCRILNSITIKNKYLIC